MRVRDSRRSMIACVVLTMCGCAVTVAPPGNPQGTQALRAFQTQGDAPTASRAATLGLKRGLYVLTSSYVYGFPADNRENGPAFCSLGGFTYPADNVEFDTNGHLIVPDYASSTITVYAAPTVSRACGQILGVIRDPFGQPLDAASLDAVSGRIVAVAQGQVDVCSLRRGCTKSLAAPYLGAPASVALSRDGDCWAEGDAPSGPGTLYYFKGCNTAGQLTSGYQGGGDNYGGLDIDKYGNIVSIFANYHNSPALYVYSGCAPACTMRSGPLPLRGTGTYGHLNKDSTEFAAADSQYSEVDVYKYSPTSLTYEYAFNRGLSSVYGAAFNPRASQ